MDSHKLHFYIDYPIEKSGWIPCFLTIDELTHRIWASGAVPPFHDLLDFLRLITINRLPAWFYWDEEGYGPYFEAWPVGNPTDPDSADFHLRIIYEANDFHWIGEGEDARALVNTYQVLWVDADLNRAAFVDCFLAPLRDFILYRKRPDSYKINLPDLLSFEHLLSRKVPARSDINHAEPVGLYIRRWQDDEEANGSQYFELRMWDMHLDHWNLDDTDAFWPQWFALLEHAVTGQPYEMSFLNMSILRWHREDVASGNAVPEEVGPDWSTRIVASPLNHPRHFRLQIFETEYRYHDFLQVDEVIDIYQLIQVFLQEFEDLLNEGYYPYLDEDGNLFDLRQLPVSRLKEKLNPQT